MASQKRAPREELTPDQSGGVPPLGITAMIFRGIERCEDRSLIFTLLKLMGESAAPGEPLINVAQLPVAHLIADPIVRAMLAAGTGPNLVDNLAVAVKKATNTKLREICPCEGELAIFADSLLFDAAEIWREPADPNRPRQLLGWFMRCGQWAWWSLSPFERAAMCRLAGAFLMASNDTVAQMVVRLGTKILEQAETAGAKNHGQPLPDVESIYEELIPCVDRTSALTILTETLQVLERGRVIGRVTYPGPRGQRVIVGEILPMQRFRCPTPLKVVQIDEEVWRI